MLGAAVLGAAVCGARAEALAQHDRSNPSTRLASRRDRRLPVRVAASRERCEGPRLGEAATRYCALAAGSCLSGARTLPLSLAWRR